MKNRAGVYGYWSSPQTFVLVGSGAAIGFGNIFSLPYLLGKYGGGAFLLVYVLSLVLVSLPLLIAELLMGRRARANVVNAARILSVEANVHAAWLWPWMGRFALAGAVLVLSYYSVIAGWSMAYVIRAASGTLFTTDATQLRGVVLALVGDPERTLAWHTLFIISATILVAQGRAGIERVARYFVPAAFFCLLVLLFNALFVGDIAAGFRLLLTPDFSKLGWEGALEALQQAFFSLGLGMGVMMTFGIYMPERISLLRVGSAVVLVDLLFALLSGLVVFAYLFAAGEVPKRGVAFVFEQLPLAINQHSGSQLSLVFLYFSLFVATMTSAMGLMEPVTVWMMERYDVSRSFATTVAGILIWFFGLGTILSFNAWQDFKLFGLTFYEWLDQLTGHLLLPAVGFWICVFVSRAMHQDVLEEAWGGGSRKGLLIWQFCLRYPARIGLLLVLLYSMGLFRLLSYLW